MEKRVLISTIYEGKALKVAITKLSPDKLILLVDKPLDKTRKKTIETLKKIFGEIIEIETLETSVYDMSKIINDVIKKIEKEIKQKNDLFIHITEGRKLTSLSLLFAAYFRKQDIKGAYYVTEEKNQLITLPLINIGLGNSKKKLLKEINNGNGEVNKLQKRLKIKQSAIYQHLQELRDEGYISNHNKELKLTDLGRIMVL